MSESAFQRLRRRVQLDRRNGWIAGVCAGIARALDTDPAFVRVGLVVVALFWTKIAIGAYLIAWIVLDEVPRQTGARDASGREAGTGHPNRR